MLSLLIVIVALALELNIVVSTAVSGRGGSHRHWHLIVVEVRGLPPAMMYSKWKLTWRRFKQLITIELTPLPSSAIFLLALLPSVRFMLLDKTAVLIVLIGLVRR